MGWNWTNSRSVTSAPARSATATPSPVDTDGVGGLAQNTCPSPPVASTTARQRHRADPVALPGADHVQGQPADPPVRAEQQVEHQGVLHHLDAGSACSSRSARARSPARSRRRRRGRSGPCGDRPRGSARSHRSWCGRTSCRSRPARAPAPDPPPRAPVPRPRRTARPRPPGCPRGAPRGCHPHRGRRRSRPAPTGRAGRGTSLVTTSTRPPAVSYRGQAP